jgi:hypothetical protein
MDKKWHAKEQKCKCFSFLRTIAHMPGAVCQHFPTTKIELVLWEESFARYSTDIGDVPWNRFDPRGLGLDSNGHSQTCRGKEELQKLAHGGLKSAAQVVNLLLMRFQNCPQTMANVTNVHKIAGT